MVINLCNVALHHRTRNALPTSLAYPTRRASVLPRDGTRNHGLKQRNISQHRAPTHRRGAGKRGAAALNRRDVARNSRDKTR